MSHCRVQVRTTSPEQYDELTAYALVKGHKNLSAFMLYAAVTMMSKNPLTPSQRQRAEQLMAGIRNPRTQ